MEHNHLFCLGLLWGREGKKEEKIQVCFQLSSDHWYLSMLKSPPRMN